jgi:hypothetical protein
MADGYKGHKPGSRKARVHECYDTKSFEAAVALGLELELAEGTVNSWLKGWAKSSGAILPKGKGPRVRGVVKEQRVSKTAVFDIANQETMRGSILKLGPQASEVRWVIDGSAILTAVANHTIAYAETGEVVACDCKECAKRPITYTRKKVEYVKSECWSPD